MKDNLYASCLCLTRTQIPKLLPSSQGTSFNFLHQNPLYPLYIRTAMEYVEHVLIRDKEGTYCIINLWAKGVFQLLWSTVIIGKQ